MDVARGRSLDQHLATLCGVSPDRRPGSVGNAEATAYVAEVFGTAGWEVVRPRFDCLNWQTAGGSLVVGDLRIELTPSPYGLGVDTTGPIRVVSDLDDVASADFAGSIVVVHGALAAEPLTPKAFPFYQHEEHKQLISALERANPAAVLAVTGRYPALCGALDPFPLIEDGDFAIPTANLRPEAAADVLTRDGTVATVTIDSERLPSRAENVIATRGTTDRRITVIAHVDSKPGTPGAVDNAAGVVTLIDIAERLSPRRRPDLPIGVELLAVNGEDHFAAPGELDWLAANEGRLDDIALVINIDGAGYRNARSAYSTYNLGAETQAHIDRSFSAQRSITAGPPWYQSDHAIFAMRGHPAVAITTELVDEMLETLFHAPTDTPDEVDTKLLADLGDGISQLILTWPPRPEVDTG